ncbi:MAG TPA: putative lipid II flippase FtsW [Candidatus Caccovivens faecavium]|nr:putative lipid II flippase FtsW [Candidatus Caccovivens faecavium]
MEKIKKFFILSKKRKFDKTTFFVTFLMFALVIFGCIMVYSASFYSAGNRYGNEYFFLFKQLLGVVLGIFAFIFFAFFDYHLLKKFRYAVLAVCVVLLVLVFVPGFGVQSYGANRWVSILGISIQPSELAKFALILYLASYLSDNHEKIKTFKGLIPPLVVAGVLCLLVIIEPSMSVTMCLLFLTFFMLIVGGINKKHTLLFSGLATLCVPLLIIAEPYRMKRLFAFLDPWISPQGEGFQLIQSLYSLGNGGMFGVGLFNSRQKYLFLPFAESDFIFSIIGEEFGFFGAILLILVFGALCYFLFKIGLSAKDRFGCLLSLGVGVLIAVQTLLNIAVVTGSIPPTGLPLPFISSGGTSVAVFMAGVGVCVNVHKQSKIA